MHSPNPVDGATSTMYRYCASSVEQPYECKSADEAISTKVFATFFAISTH